MQSPDFVLSYWNIRGTTQSLRNLLEYLAVNYQDRVIEWPKDVEYNLSDMLAYTNLPNLRHGDLEVTEIVPIGKYLCRSAKRTDLLGKNLRDEADIDGFIIKTFHARKVYLDAMTSCEPQDQSQFEQMMMEKMKGLRQTFLKSLIERLSTKEWYMGYLTVADFFLYNVLFYFQGFVSKLVSNEVIDTYMTRFENIQAISKYMKSGKANHPPSICEQINKRWKGKRNYK